MLELKAHSSDVKANESIMQLKSMLDAHISLTTPYFCPNCGLKVGCCSGSVLHAVDGRV